MRVALPLVLALVACGGKDTQRNPADPTTSDTSTVGTTPGTTTTPTVVREALSSPAEATDLDPDPAVLRVDLTAAPYTFDIGDQTVDGYAYNGQIPGPTLRASVGDELIVTLTNDLPDPTTIHWHGLHVPWDMDGVTWMQDPIDPGETFEYRFTLNQTGTFWYHPHFDTERQVDLGLYGVLVVEDPAEPAVDDAIWVFDTWAEHEAAADEAGEHVHGPDATVRTWTVNGLVTPEWTPTAGATRLRLLNASNTGYLKLDDVRILAGDQGLNAAVQNGTALLGPGDRVELEWTGPATILESQPYAAAGGEAWGDPVELLAIADGPVGNPVSWPVSGALPTADPGTTDITWVLHGDGDAATWMINGEQFPDVTIPEVSTGADAIIELRNLSAAEHPFHLHGTILEVLSIDGVPPTFQRIEDTVNVEVGQIVRLRAHPDNPGDWMAHCHILPHAELGMMTVLRALP